MSRTRRGAKQVGAELGGRRLGPNWASPGRVAKTQVHRAERRDARREPDRRLEEWGPNAADRFDWPEPEPKHFGEWVERKFMHDMLREEIEPLLGVAL